MKRGIWGTRFGFYLAAIGTAFGLGNLWRFPYVAGENGGGAFVLIYVWMALLVGLPLLLGELMLGRVTRKSVLQALQSLMNDPRGDGHPPPRYWKFFGRLPPIVCLLVLSYYAVISGWVLNYFLHFFFGLFGHPFEPQQVLSSLKEHGWWQVALAGFHLFVTLVVVARGVEEGIERWVGYMMSAFVALLCFSMMKSLSLPRASEAIRFLFYPDFSKLTMSSLIEAVGHAMFTLSVGFGTMVTYGSYLRPDAHIPTAAFKVTVMDTVISLLAGLLIFPVVMSGVMESGFGPEILFQSMPSFFVKMDGGMLFGLAFFLCLYLAALGASIGLLETVVSNWVDRRNVRRKYAAWASGGMVLLISCFPALSSTVFRNVSFRGMGILQILDSVLINWILPVAALGVSFVTFRLMKEENVRREFNDPNNPDWMKLYLGWKVAIRWVVPGVIILAMVLQILGALRTLW